MVSPAHHKPHGGCSHLLTTRSNFANKISRSLFSLHFLSAVFVKSIQSGFVDLNLYFRDDNQINCILSSIYFGLLWLQCNQDIKQAIMNIAVRFKSKQEFVNSFHAEYCKFNLEKFNRLSHLRALNYISYIIKRQIILFVTTNGQSFKFRYHTGYRNKAKEPLCIMCDLKANHTVFMFDV